MANYQTDQAEGLRRMLAGPKPRIFTFLSALPEGEKSAMLINLGASLVRTGSNVLMVDTSMKSSGVMSRLGMTPKVTLLEVARKEGALHEVVQAMPQGFGIATLTRGPSRVTSQCTDQSSRLTNAFGTLAKKSDIVLVDGELGADDSFPISTMTQSEIVVQVSTSATSIKNAYAIIKRLNAKLGRHPFSLLVTGATDKEAQVVYENMAQAASRYLAVELHTMGSVPADEHLKKAANLGRSVVEAFPLALASVAFRRLAGRCSLSEISAAGLRGTPSTRASMGR
ncbi:MAG: MinD/ParA family ATP-binding protein [Burkholderiaceae bacterium]